MKNVVQGKATYYYLYETEMDMTEVMTKFNVENIIDMKLSITLTDGSVHKVQLCELLSASIDSFEVDGEEMIEEEIENKEKITKLNPVIKIAI